MGFRWAGGQQPQLSSGDPVKLRKEHIDGAEAWQLRTSSQSWLRATQPHLSLEHGSMGKKCVILGDWEALWKTTHLPSGLRQVLKCQNQNDAGHLPNTSGLPSLPLQPFDR